MRARTTLAAAAIALVAASACTTVPANEPLPADKASGGAAGGSLARSAAAPPLHDLFVGAPGAGVVDVRLEGTGRRQEISHPTGTQEGERFGAAVLYTMLDTTYDRWFALVGSPGLDVNGKADAGGVHVFERAVNSWTYVDTLTQDDPGIPGSAQAGAEFGSAFDVTAGEDHEPATVYVGAPGLDVNGARAAGGVFVLDLTHYVGGDDIGGSLVTLADRRSPRDPMAGDRLGAVLGEGFVGAPGATVDGRRGAGLALELPYPGDEDSRFVLYQQGRNGVPGAPEAGDAFGSSFGQTWASDVRTTWIGVPGEDVGAIADAGMVNSLDRDESDDGDFTWKGGRAFTQNTADDGSGKPVEGVAEAGDRFGTSVCGSSPDPAVALYAGTPGEDIGAVRDAGSVTGLLGADSQSEDTVGGRPAAGERFGSTVHCLGISLDGEDLVIGAPGAARGAGLVAHGVHRNGGTIAWERWTRELAEPGDAYGSGVFSRLPY